MAAKLGSTDVSFRLGSAEVSKVYIGAVEAWSAVTVPGKPPTLSVIDFSENDEWVATIGVPDDGGSAITDYRIYVDGVFLETTTFEDPTLLSVRFIGPLSPGDSITASAVNAIGEGPQSDPFVVT